MDEYQAGFALGLARKALSTWLETGKELELKSLPEFLKEKKGVFVTLWLWPELELRGCIGIPYPVFRLDKAIISSAIQAGQDPRFEPVKAEELKEIVFELSVLTQPKPVEADPEEYPKLIKIGRDGLIIQARGRSGLLLPQVAVEHGMDENEFLIQVCLKAGLPPLAWKEPGVKLYTFQAEVWRELEPEGPPERIILSR